MSRARQGGGVTGFHYSPNVRYPYQDVQRLRRTASSDDIFSVNPLRRSFTIAGVSWLAVIIPAFFMQGDAQALILIGAGWLAAAGIIFVTPIFFWFLIEDVWATIRRRTNPLVDELGLSSRALNLLYRHGYETISSVDRTPDSSLLLLSNMDHRALHEIRRAISIWKYQRWQERGFPQGETPENTY